jgi:hypothetical protein
VFGGGISGSRFVAALGPYDSRRDSKLLSPAERSSYDVKMSDRVRFAVAALALLPMALLGGCKPKPKLSTVVVTVVRNLRSPYGSEMDRRILEFQGSNPRLSSGQAILVETETGDYKDMLQKQTSSSEYADIIILDSPDDAQASPPLQIALPQATNVCAGMKACPANIPAIVPPQITGDKRQAAEMFVDFLKKTPS